MLHEANDTTPLDRFTNANSKGEHIASDIQFVAADAVRVIIGNVNLAADPAASPKRTRAARGDAGLRSSGAAGRALDRSRIKE